MKDKSVKANAAKLINVPTTLFIDTSYYVSQGLKFTTSDIEKLKKHFKPKSLRLIVPVVARRELEKKFGERADAAVQAIHKAEQEHPIGLMSNWPYANKSELKMKLLALLESEWGKFQAHFKVVRLADNGNLEQVLDWFFDKKPPFGEGKKEKEFPDALMISVLDKYCAKHKVKIAVISLDPDFLKACESRPNFEYFKSLAPYLEKSIAEQTIVQRIHELLAEKDDVFRTGIIAHHFETLEFTVGQDWEGCCVSDLEDINVEVQEQSVIDLEGTKFTVAAEGFVSFKVNWERLEFSPYSELRDARRYTTSGRIRFTATVEMKADAEFKELKLEDYSITHFSPESIFINYEQ